MNARRLLVSVALGVALIGGACGDDDLPSSAVLTAAPMQATTTNPTPVTTSDAGDGGAATTTSPPETTSTTPSPDTAVVPELLEGLPLALISVDGELLVVAVADNGGSRRQGLMNVEDLLDLDGMLFVWSDDTNGGFWMKDTLLPLDIAFFTADGSLVDTFAMEPCTESPCPTYTPAGAYRYALETGQGRLGELDTDAALAFVDE